MSAAANADVRVAEQPSRRVLFLRHVGPYTSVGPTFQKLMGYAFQKGLFSPVAEVLGVCHDDPACTPADNLRYDASITVGEHVAADGEFGIQSLAGGEYAIATHRGPYESLGDTYKYLYGEWLSGSGREPRAAPPFEIYRNNPTDTKPEDLLTEIFLPLAPK